MPPASSRSAVYHMRPSAWEPRPEGALMTARRRRALQQLLRPLAEQPTGAAGTRRGDSAALEAIWQVVCAIPRGQVSTYGAVARAAGLPGRARQAGYALR